MSKYNGNREFKINIPGSVKLIIDVLENNGYEAFAVGGCVRAVSYTHRVGASGEKKFQDERLTEILNYINTNYLTVTLDELEEQFHLSKP